MSLSRKQKIKDTKGADISTGATVEIQVSVDLHIQVRFVQQNCDYLHVTRANDDGKESEAHQIYPCIGCKNVYEDKVCVVQHIVQNVGFFSLPQL